VLAVGVTGRATSSFNRAGSAQAQGTISQSTRRVAGASAGAVAFNALARAPAKAANENVPPKSGAGGGDRKPPVNAKMRSDDPAKFVVLAVGSRTIVGQFINDSHPRANISGGTVGLKQKKIISADSSIKVAIGELKKSTESKQAAVSNNQKIWTKGNEPSPRKNAEEHWKGHAHEFPELKSMRQYVLAAHKFAIDPPAGTLPPIVRTEKGRGRDIGDKVFYHPESNTILIVNSEGTPKTMFKPNTEKHPFETNLEYFYAQG
jgi:hypothetical protein